MQNQHCAPRGVLPYQSNTPTPSFSYHHNVLAVVSQGLVRAASAPVPLTPTRTDYGPAEPAPQERALVGGNSPRCLHRGEFQYFRNRRGRLRKYRRHGAQASYRIWRKRRAERVAYQSPKAHHDGAPPSLGKRNLKHMHLPMHMVAVCQTAIILYSPTAQFGEFASSAPLSFLERRVYTFFLNAHTCRTTRRKKKVLGTLTRKRALHHMVQGETSTYFLHSSL